MGGPEEKTEHLPDLDEALRKIAEINAPSTAPSAPAQPSSPEPRPLDSSPAESKAVEISSVESHPVEAPPPEPENAEPEGVLPDPVPAEPAPLEEVTYPSNAPGSLGPQVGETQAGWTLIKDLGRGWFKAEHGEERAEIYVRPEPGWAQVQAHKLLPASSKLDGWHLINPASGEVLLTPLPLPKALEHLRELARLLFALEKQGWTISDLDPQSLLEGPQGVQFSRPPRLTRLGEQVPAAVRDGYDPPELLAGQAVTSATGVYLLGALLFEWLTGKPLPSEGPSPSVLSSVREPGMPALLTQLLSPAPQRPNPSGLLSSLQRLLAPPPAAYLVAGASTVGLNPDRPVNEDAYGYSLSQYQGHEQNQVNLRACVSDGMGGMAAGEVASQAAVRAFLNSRASIEQAIWEANTAVLEAMQGRDGGCTLSGLEFQGAQLQLGHVGDTRVYLWSGEQLRQLTQDHSYVAAMVAHGQLSAEEARNSPDRNKVLRSLGSLRQPQPEYVQTLHLEVQPSDRLLLISDGVWGEVSDQVLQALLQAEFPLQQVVDRLIHLALEAGAPDNATALIIERVR